jgi:UDP-N-acetylmuramyl-tripeptide synthetase/UDP-N-acetylmuramoyl-tripeptide--D-alanyl-D-alanine ligase
MEALAARGLVKEAYRLQVSGFRDWCGAVQTDNRLLEPGDIFVCIKGEKFDAHRFIPNAITKGAALIVGEEDLQLSIPYICVTDSRKAAAIIAKTLLGKIPFQIIGVTGTNGKTTTSLILYEALRDLGYKCGWIGTLGYYIGSKQYSTGHTTPDVIQLNNIFKQMADDNIEYVIMEVSSHALSLDRVYGVDFNYCLFSNLSREHLDFHGSMENYAEAKYKLFEMGIKSGATALVNTADSFGAEICTRLHASTPAPQPPSTPVPQHPSTCHSLGGANADFDISDILIELDHSSFTIIGESRELHIHSSLIGSFNVQNLALSAVTLCVMGFSTEQIEAVLQHVPPVKGRIQKVDNPHNIGVFIDYAHTPDALENLLKSVEELPHKRIICLFGAGGNRDKGKRPLMLKAALKHSDAVIVTDDNPRYEAPNSIIRDIVIDCDPRLPWWIIRDRSTAIAASIRLANPGDLVLICGKGHESYQEIEGIRHHFDDYEEAKHALDKWNDHIIKDDDELILPVDVTMLELLYGVELAENQAARHFSYISTDSRLIKPGSLFFTIIGEHFDGHNYVQSVINEPDNFVIAENFDNAASIIKVKNSIQSLGLLCQKYLQMFELKRIALTGSTGKTTAKEMIAAILEDSLPCLKTFSNENNIIGLCKTILRVMPTHRYAVFELGTNHFGEIAALAEIVCPDIGIILNVGPSHLEFLGDEDGVYLEKSALFKRPLALRLFPGDDPRFEGTVGISIGYSDFCQYQITEKSCGKESQSFMLAGSQWQLPYAAPHFAINAAFAITLALQLGLFPEKIQASLMKPINIGHRMQIEPRGKGTLIIDCYNANPCSMQKALEFWQIVQPENPHVAILGDMLELGESSEMYHQMIGAMLLEMKFSKLFTVGAKSRLYHNPDDFAPLNYVSTNVLLSNLKQHFDVGDNSVILIKASHGMHLELLIPFLRGAN